MTIMQQHPTTSTQGSGARFLDVDDVQAARADLIRRGVDVGEIWHIEPGRGRVPGRDPERRSYLSRASFADPDRNAWVLEETTERVPGRREMHDAGALPRLLFETARRHGAFAAVPAPHDWWDWYGAFLEAREQGSTPEKAAEAAERYTADVGHVGVVTE
jgi:hypothetical protein